MNFCTGSRGSNLLLLSHPQSIHCSTTSTIPACEIGIINPLILLKHLHGRNNNSNNVTISSNNSDKNSKVVMNSSSSKCFMSKDSRISKTETCKMCNRTDNKIEISLIQTDFLIIKTDFLTTRTDFLTTKKDFLIIRTDFLTTRT